MVNTGLVHNIWTVTAIVDIRPAQNIDPPPQASSNVVGLLLNQSRKLQFDLVHDGIIFIAFRVSSLATPEVSDVQIQRTNSAYKRHKPQASSSKRRTLTKNVSMPTSSSTLTSTQKPPPAPHAPSPPPHTSTPSTTLSQHHKHTHEPSTQNSSPPQSPPHSPSPS